jgi:hypothetical protein
VSAPSGAERQNLRVFQAEVDQGEQHGVLVGRGVAPFIPPQTDRCHSRLPSIEPWLDDPADTAARVVDVAETPREHMEVSVSNPRPCSRTQVDPNVEVVRHTARRNVARHWRHQAPSLSVPPPSGRRSRARAAEEGLEAVAGTHREGVIEGDSQAVLSHKRAGGMVHGI